MSSKLERGGRNGKRNLKYRFTVPRIWLKYRVFCLFPHRTIDGADSRHQRVSHVSLQTQSVSLSQSLKASSLGWQLCAERTRSLRQVISVSDWLTIGGAVANQGGNTSSLILWFLALFIGEAKSVT